LPYPPPLSGRAVPELSPPVPAQQTAPTPDPTLPCPPPAASQRADSRREGDAVPLSVHPGSGGRDRGAGRPAEPAALSPSASPGDGAGEQARLRAGGRAPGRAVRGRGRAAAPRRGSATGIPPPARRPPLLCSPAARRALGSPDALRSQLPTPALPPQWRPVAAGACLPSG